MRARVRCGMRARFLGMGLGVECARDFSVWGWVWNAPVNFRYGVGCKMRACFHVMGFRVECVRVFSVWG